MRKFTQLLENQEIDAKLTSDFKRLKQLLVSGSSFENTEELKATMAENVRAFKNETAVTIDGFRETGQLYKFWQDNSAEVDALLESGEWFNTVPGTLGIKGLKQYVIEATKFALSSLCQQVLDDLGGEKK